MPSPPRRLPRRRRPHAHRPLQGRRSPPSAPTTSRRTCSRRCVHAQRRRSASSSTRSSSARPTRRARTTATSARMAALLAGLPFEVPAVDRQPPLRLRARGGLRRGPRGSRPATPTSSIAGGVESMTRAPFAFGKTDEAFSRTPPKVFDTTLGWRFENPQHGRALPAALDGRDGGGGRGQVGHRRARSRTRSRVASQKKAAAAVAAGAFDREIVPGPHPAEEGASRSLFAKDESPRGDVTLEGLAKLRAGVPQGRHGHGRQQLAHQRRRVGRARRERGGRRGPRSSSRWRASWRTPPPACTRTSWARGPIPAGKKALARAGWSVKDLDLVELNEAFAAQSLACMRGPRARRGEGQRARRRHRPRAPHRLERGAHPGHAAWAMKAAGRQAGHGGALHRGGAGDRHARRAFLKALHPMGPDALATRP